MSEQSSIVVVEGRKYDSDLRTDTDRDLADANRVLFTRVTRYLHRLPRMTNAAYARLQGIVEDHRAEMALKYGITYPQLVAVWLDGIRVVKLIRADIERKTLETTLVNWTVEHPDVTAQEIARAIVRHFPGYKPAQLVA